MAGPTVVAEWNAARGDVTLGELTPADFGLTEADPAGLRGGEAADNATALRRVLAGEDGPVRTGALLAAGAALVACDRAEGFRVGAEMAAAAIDSGRAAATLDRWARLSREAT